MQKRKVKTIHLGRIICLLLIILALGIGGYKVYDTYFINSNNASNNSNGSATVKPTVTTASLVMVGDALIHSYVYKDAKQSDGSYDFSHMFTKIASTIKGYDLAYYNQESILGGAELGYSGYPNFNAPQAFGDNMVDMGFNLVSLANNHVLDKGEKGITNSVNYWKTKTGVMTAGTYLSEEDRVKDNIGTINGITYSLLSYTTLTNGYNVPSGKSYLVDTYDKDKVKADVERLRDKVDVLIVAMHWGVEYTNTPTAEEKEIAKYLASLGVDIVIGTHPHVIQPIEYIDGTLVFYSLGNFISRQVGTDKLTGMMASLNITKTVNGDKTTINIGDVKASLIYTYYKNSANFSIIPFNELTTANLSDYQEVYNKYSGIITSLDDSISVASLDNE